MNVYAKFSKLFLLTLMISGCTFSEQGYLSFGDSKESQKTAKFRVVMVDAPAKIEKLEKVIVTIDKVQIGSENAWHTITTESREYDLLELAGDLSAVIGEKSIPVGEYEQIRLILG